MKLTPAQKEMRDNKEYLEDAKRYKDPCGPCESRELCRTFCEIKQEAIKEAKNV